VLRWRCLEVGCETLVEASCDEELVEGANAHVREAHDSYELEEVILAGAEDQPPEETAPRWTSRSATVEHVADANAVQTGATGDPGTR
jgi:predicted small metal-binding protein